MTKKNKLPWRYRAINVFLRPFGRRYYELHFTRWYVDDDGEIKKSSIATGEYMLGSRAEFNLPDDASSIERFIANVMKWRPL